MLYFSRFREHSSAGRASALQAEGHRFEPYCSHQGTFHACLLLSGCGAAGSAGGLGACDRLISRPPKAREISVFLAFPRFSATVCFGKKLLTTDLTTYGFDRKIEYFHPSGCGAAGSARSLGLRCRRFKSGHSDQKTRF